MFPKFCSAVFMLNISVETLLPKNDNMSGFLMQGLFRFGETKFTDFSRTFTIQIWLFSRTWRNFENNQEVKYLLLQREKEESEEQESDQSMDQSGKLIFLTQTALQRKRANQS